MPRITSLQLSNIAKATLASTIFLLLAGCGIGTVDHSTTVSPTTFQGKVIGGENPITYSLVSFYETAATGVATATSTQGNGIYIPAAPVTALGSTYTDYQGNFSFSTPLACSNSSDFVYATAAGGNPGNNAINDNILLMAAVGPCSSFGASTSVVINELTTVAAAYALSSFTSISGAYTHANGAALSGVILALIANGDTTFSASNSLVSGQLVTFAGCTVLEGDPAGTQMVLSATPSQFTIAGQYIASNCTVTPTTVVTSPTVSVTSSATNYLGAFASCNGQGCGVHSGDVYAPSATHLAGLAHAFANAANLINPAVGVANSVDPSNAAAILPTSLINTLGNVLQGCVNSTGGAANSAATAGCPALFYNSTISTTTSAGTNTITPNDTLQATLNIAHAPAQNVAKLFNVAPAQAAFSPSLAAAPHDFSLAIAYPQNTGENNGNDTCVISQFPPPPSGTNGLCEPFILTIDYADNIFVGNQNEIPSYNVIAFTSAGANLFTTANTAGGSYNIAADNLGNVFYTTSSGNVLEIIGASTTSSSSPSSTTLGMPPDTPSGLAIDSSNNLYVTPGTPYTSNNVYKYPFGSYSAVPTLIGSSSSNLTSLQPAIDASGNIWLAPLAPNSAQTPTVLLNAPILTTDTSELLASGDGGPALGGAVDSQGNAWFDSADSLYKVTHTGSGTAISAAASALALSNIGTQLAFANFDGNNDFLAVDEVANTMVVVPTLSTTLAAQSFSPCIPGTAATCPSNNVTGLSFPRFVQADSTGSLWIANPGNSSLLQVFGLAAPAWPLSHQTPGVMP